MIYPKPIAPGAGVGLIAPGSPVTPEERRYCQRILGALGFSVITGEALKRDDDLHGYLAGTAMDRARDINRMFADPGVEAIFCVRGGYGSSQLLPYLDYDCIHRNPKIFVGYSDVTSIHTVLQSFCGMVTFHGPMVKPDLGRLTEGKEYMLRSLFTALGGKDAWVFENPPGEELPILVPGYGEGILTGGNLSVLARSLGTPYAPKTCGKILFLEDIGESIPRIHMYLTQMQYAGVFEGVRGVLLGDFTDCGGEAKTADAGEESGSRRDLWNARSLLEEFLKGSGLPVIGNVCSDHRHPMGTLPLGAFCRLRAVAGSPPRIAFSRIAIAHNFD